jgi:hypothetical protein
LEAIVKDGFVKGVFSHILWGVYTLGVMAALVMLASRIMLDAGFPFWSGIIVAVLIPAVCAGLIFGIHFLKEKISVAENFINIVKIADYIVVAICVIMGIVLRVTRISGADGAEHYFDLAKVTNDHGLQKITQGMSHLIEKVYVYALHGVLRIFGNKIVVLAYFQVILQIAALLLLGIVVFRLAGRFAGTFFLAYTMFSRHLIASATTLSYDSLYFLFVGIILLLLCLSREHESMIGFLCCGILTGGLISMDLCGVVLLVFAAGLIFREPDDIYYEIDHKAGSFLLLFSGVILVPAFLFVWSFFKEGMKPLQILVGYLKNFYSVGYHFPDSLMPQVSYTDLLILTGFLTVGFFTYWMYESEVISIWILSLLPVGIIAWIGFYSPELHYGKLIFMICVVIAGGNMGNILSGFKMKEKIKGSSFVSKEVLFTGVSETDVPDKTQPIPNLSGVPGVAAGTTAPVGPSADATPAKPQMIENPLPVPKRHKKPMLDFDIDVLTGKDYYDVKVSDTDDYDI